MPLGPNVQANIKELIKDNKRKGKARGQNGKPRSMKQIIAIANKVAKEFKDGTYGKKRPKKKAAKKK